MEVEHASNEEVAKPLEEVKNMNMTASKKRRSRKKRSKAKKAAAAAAEAEAPKTEEDLLREKVAAVDSPVNAKNILPTRLRRSVSAANSEDVDGTALEASEDGDDDAADESFVFMPSTIVEAGDDEAEPYTRTVSEDAAEPDHALDSVAAVVSEEEPEASAEASPAEAEAEAAPEAPPAPEAEPEAEAEAAAPEPEPVVEEEEAADLPVVEVEEEAAPVAEAPTPEAAPVAAPEVPEAEEEAAEAAPAAEEAAAPAEESPAVAVVEEEEAETEEVEEVEKASVPMVEKEEVIVEKELAPVASKLDGVPTAALDSPVKSPEKPRNCLFWWRW